MSRDLGLMNIQQARVVTHRESSGGYALLALDAPSVSESVVPGQFIHLRVPGLDAAVLRRPFSIFRVEGTVLWILYKQIGLGTRTLAVVRPGAEVSIIGPLGNGFPVPDESVLPVMVAGGYGVAPLCFLASRCPRRGLVFAGGRSAEDILCIEDFESLGWELRLATEDGTLGQKGLVTDVLDAWIDSRPGDETIELFACGPDGMLRAVGDRAMALDVKAWLSLDKHMGCGVGACLACVQKIRRPDGSETWKRVCRDGPVFESREIVWEPDEA